jgi:hypothetical protein
MKDDRFWEEGVNQLRHPRPCDPILLEDGGLMSYGVELRESFRGRPVRVNTRTYRIASATAGSPRPADMSNSTKIAQSSREGDIS